MKKKLGQKLKDVVVNRIPGAGRLKVPKTWTKTYSAALGDVRRVDGEGVALVSYNKEGSVDYETYKAVQEEGNRAKLHGQWVTRGHIHRLAEFARDRGVTVRQGVCHGTRQGFEQLWFREAFGDAADVFGTEISSTATDFPNTVQWDFHEANPDWQESMDLVYSNSWDHAYDPEKAFSAWIDTLAPGGLLMLDHSRYHLPDRANELDPFGAELDALKAMVSRLGGDGLAWAGAVEDLLSDDTTSAPVDLPVITLVWQKAA